MNFLILSQTPVRDFSPEVRAKTQTKVLGLKFETAKDWGLVFKDGSIEDEFKDNNIFMESLNV